MAARTPAAPVAVMTFPAIGTTAAVVVTDPAAAPEARAIVERMVSDLDRACSRFREDSELSALNAAAGRPVRASALLMDAIEVALRGARLTAGRVSPTVGTAMRLIGYDRDFSKVLARSPAGPERAGLAPVVRISPVPGWRMVLVDRSTSTVRIPPGVELDLGATAKAFCADQAARAAAGATGSGVLVSLGGDIAVAGEPPECGWVIQVTDDHAADSAGGGQTVSIVSGGLATSSTTVRRWAGLGGTVHHIVDPATGRPAAGGWRTVSVVAATCVDANIASTAGIILGPEAPAWLAERGLSARLVTDDGQVVRVGGWPADQPDDQVPPRRDQARVPR